MQESNFEPVRWVIAGTPRANVMTAREIAMHGMLTRAWDPAFIPDVDIRNEEGIDDEEDIISFEQIMINAKK